MNNVAHTYTTRSIKSPCDLLALHRHNSEQYPFLLQSTAKADSLDSEIASQHARYNVLFAFPQGEITLLGDKNVYSDQYNVINNNFLDSFNHEWQSQSAHIELTAKDGIESFLGWFLYVSYEFAQFIEPTLNLPIDASEIIARATRIPLVIVNDIKTDECFIVCEKEYASLIPQILNDIDRITNDTTLYPEITHTAINEDDSRQYLDGIGKIKRYIYDGDVFQVNFSRNWDALLDDEVTATDMYVSLTKNNPAPFSGLVHYKEFDIISSSPERLVKTQNNKIQTRPIAGTRPRTSNDASILSELLAHPKERAEHIMLIDLERNDLGRVCKPGSVEVTELMSLESFAHVHHIVSNIEGTLRTNILPGDVLRAVFPGGTITGCPKVRCMEIIAELEQTPRGAYTGSIGYVGHNGNMDLNILIRTMIKKGNQIQFRAGAGIVSDSKAEFELEETRAKAKGLLLSLNSSAA